jgi:site-specific DNA-methyltransferase (adenine-specific)
MARKPLVGTVANNVLEYGVGGINIDGCRVGNEKVSTHSNGVGNTGDKGIYGTFGNQEGSEEREGRFPANIIFECTCENPKVVADKYDIRAYNDYKNTFQSYEENDKDKGEYEIKYVETTKVIHTDPNCPCYILDQQSGTTKSGFNPNADTKQYKGGVFGGGETNETTGYTDKGGASRFFYCPKASKKDRDEGMPDKVGVFIQRPRREDGSVIYKETHPEEWATAMEGKPRREKTSLAASEEILQPTTKGTMNTHPTVKPIDLMTYLIRLVTPKGGVVLDPFMGSGSTGKAAVLEGMNFIGIEREEEYYEIAKQRIENEINKRKFF